MSSVRTNFALNMVNTISGLLFPLITFPYISRILLADGIGQIAFYNSIIGYISLFSALGLPFYAVREIARVRNDKKKCSETAIEILTLHTILTFAGYFVVFVLCLFVSKIKTDILLFLILSLSLFFTAIGANWFYQGVEDFKYITVRALVVRLISLVCLFLFVHEKSDILVYASISVLSEVGGNIFNFFRLRKYVDKSVLYNIRELNIRKHLKPALKIFILNLTTSIYINLDSVMLGFLSSDKSVGFYSAATRLTKAILAVVQSLGAVLLPRFSNLIENNRMDEFKSMAQKAVNFVLAVSLPMTIGVILLSGPIIRLFAGQDFDSAILTLQLVSPILLMIAVSGIVGLQILYPQGKESIVIIATAIGAVVNFSLNLILIPRYAHNGAAFATTVAESCVTISMIIMGKKFIPIKLFTTQAAIYLLGAIIIGCVVIFVSNYSCLNDIYKILISVTTSVIIYCFWLLMLKDPFALEGLNILKHKLIR